MKKSKQVIASISIIETSNKDHVSDNTKDNIYKFHIIGENIGTTHLNTFISILITL